jgi:hypothetical protein
VEDPGPGQEQRDEGGVQSEGAHEAATEPVAIEDDVESAGCKAGFHGAALVSARSMTKQAKENTGVLHFVQDDGFEN